MKGNEENKLKSLRIERGLTIQQMAEILEVSQGSYNYYELGKTEPSIEKLKKLSDLFCVSIDYLVGSTSRIQPVAPLGDALTQDEKDLVKFYRGLNNVQKETVAVLAESLYGKNKAEVGKIS